LNGGVAILYIGRGFLKSASTPESTKELYRSTDLRKAAPGIGRHWYSLTILPASSSIVSALKKYPPGSTCGGLTSHASRAAASASKIAQMGPPPLNFLGSPVHASAAA